MRSMFVVVLLAGCGADVGGPCAIDSPCPDGQICDLTNPDGDPICLAGDGDLDGDGLRNDRDFCEHQNGGAFDEDLDGIGDDCDRCPIAAPAAEPDRDTDDIDSPCDPDPTIDGDQMVVFNGFNEPLPSTWKAGPAWKVQGGEIVVTPAGPATSETLTVPLPLVSTHIAIQARYRIDRIEGTGGSSVSVLGVDRRPAGTTTVSCGGSRIGTTDRVFLDTTTATASKNFVVASLFDTAGLYRVAAKLDGAQAACALIADRESAAVQANGPGEAMTEGGLTTLGVTARFSYLLVVQRAP